MRLAVDSRILTQSLARQISAHAKLADAKWELLYRATRDGATVQAFHRLCDGRDATVTVARVKKNGALIGGYTRVAWTSPSRGQYKHDETAFVINKRADAALITKFALRHGKEHVAVFHSALEGPRFNCFGLLYHGGLDEGWSHSGVYDIPGGARDFAGVDTEQFEVDEIEVFAV